jgi:fumarate hydratase class II
MNVNEVIAYRGHVLKGGKLTDKEKFLHPNDDVNKSQSSNDTFPTAMHMLLTGSWCKQPSRGSKNSGTPWLKKVKNSCGCKDRRTHFMDATPLTVGQEFSGYVSQLDHGLKTIKNSLAHLSELALGGTAVGTGINTPHAMLKMSQNRLQSLPVFPL